MVEICLFWPTTSLLKFILIGSDVTKILAKNLRFFRLNFFLGFKKILQLGLYFFFMNIFF